MIECMYGLSAAIVVEDEWGVDDPDRTLAAPKHSIRQRHAVEFSAECAIIHVEDMYIRPLAVAPLLDILSGGDPLGLLFFAGGEQCSPV